LVGFDYNTPGAYFITVCTKDRKNLLGRIVGDGALDVPEVQLTTAGKVLHKHIIGGNRVREITVDKFVIMPNHFHMILLVNEVGNGTSRAPSPTNAIIPHFISTLKRFCNQEIGYNIFQRSYHDHVIRGEKDYLTIWEYIDGNPGKWREDCFYTE